MTPETSEEEGAIDFEPEEEVGGAIERESFFRDFKREFRDFKKVVKN